MSLTSFILFKYLKFDKTQPFISIAALLAFVGIGIGVMVLIVAMAIMNGMSKEFTKQLFVLNHSITIKQNFRGALNDTVLADLKKRHPNLKFSPFLQMQTIARQDDGFQAGLITGVDFQAEAMQNQILKATLDSIGQADKPFPLIIGKDLQDRYLLGRGDKLLLFFTSYEPTGLSLSPTSKRFNIVGVFDSGISAYDSGYLYTSIEALRAIRGDNYRDYDGIYVKSNNPTKDIQILKSELKNVSIKGFWSDNAHFFSALELEKRALFIVLMLIILMASLNIISSLLMVVMNRRKEIALLMSFGASKEEIKKIFFLLGVTIGGGGIVLGLILSAAAIFALGHFDIITLPADVYGVSKLPLDLSTLDFSMILVGAILIVSLSSYYPAARASKINALEVLRNE